ncbi:undecaprenyl-diphosphate phosphatase (plasmid) [Phyllobacterium sp. 628]|uniref:undecaprenyl-diphosphate phosphatase n=1 Tax=Phyllobacterium sp. 628 TaxID=2718938 RepID=UPI00166229F9|nr:undecaprenyl-diphosphate phosphatase [Phyllobacterium sp. 628]QND55113.1 undecaprenyl-diphosphate phosphatase [Phyllobacterium sp. 628]
MSGACTQGVDTGFVVLGATKVAILGVVQGITELLPVSSTAHMRLVPALLGWQDPGSAFSAAMQLAALTAVICYFWKDIYSITAGSIGAVRTGDWMSPKLRMSVGIVLGTIPIVVAGLLLAPLLNACDSPLRALPVIGFSCLIMGILLAVAEFVCRHKRQADDMRLRDALIVGIAQVGALIPGVSRSGSTLTAALFRDFTRQDAARFSFLLGIPAIALAGLHELVVLVHAHLPVQGWAILLVGLVAGSISSFAALWGLMRILERFSTWPFIIYRIALGIVILWISFG